MFVNESVDMCLVWEAPVMTGLDTPTNSPLIQVGLLGGPEGGGARQPRVGIYIYIYIYVY